jgi:hypothetical protein
MDPEEAYDKVPRGEVRLILHIAEAYERLVKGVMSMYEYAVTTIRKTAA